ncbi:hypothetical protein DN612_08750 [Aeromonas caviae]|nr:hypothetical protein DN612_08750 [Aeromonas caviae]
MIMKDSPVHRWDMRNGHDSVTRLQVRSPGRFAKGTGYSITKRGRITLMSDGIWAGRGQKNKREREAPQSGIQMLLVVLCSLRSTGTSYSPTFPRAIARL